MESLIEVSLNVKVEESGERRESESEESESEREGLNGISSKL